MIKVIALIGKAGSGKDTLLHSIMEQYPSAFNEIVSCTSRAPRQGEVDGVNYFFLSKEEFIRKIDSGDMLESTIFNGWYYGTMKSSLSIEKVNIGVFNPSGVYSLMQDPEIDLTVYYLRAPAKVRLLRQLNREENPDVQEIIRRFSADDTDFQNVEDNIHCITLSNVVPSDLQDMVERIVGQNQLIG